MRFGHRLVVIGSVLLAVAFAVACTHDDGANPAAGDPGADGALDAASSDAAVEADAERPLGVPGALCDLPIQGGELYRCPPGFEDCIPFLTSFSPHPGSYCVKKVIVGEGQNCDNTEGAVPADFVDHMCDAGLVCAQLPLGQFVCRSPASLDAGPDADASP